MTTPGSNSTQPVQSNFNGTFPIVGAAVGMLGTTGTMVPFNSDASGNLLVSSSGGGGTTAVNLTEVGGSAIVLGQGVMASSLPVVIASNQSPISVTGSFTGSSPAVSTTGQAVPAQADYIGVNVGGTLQAPVAVIVTTLNATAYVPRVDLSSVNGTSISLGQNVATGSIPVVIASNQTAIPVTGSITASNPSVSTTGQAAPAEATYLGVNVGGTLQAPVAVIATSINATAYVPRFDLSSMGGTALALGQAVMATSLPVVIASNQSNLTTVIANASITALVSGTVTAVVSGTVTANLAAGSNAIGTVTALQGAAPWTQNITQISGTAFTMGQAVMATSLPVVIASNQSNLTTIIANASITALVSGTVTAVQSGTWAINISQIAGQTVATGGATGLLAIGGAAATNAAIVGFPVMFGGRAQTGEIGTTTNGSAVMAAFDAVGRIIAFPYANKENYLAGATSTIASTLLQVIASVNATNRIYITSAQLSNISTATTVVVTFNDSKTSNFIVPYGGGSNINFPVPLQFGLGSAMSFSTAPAVSTVYVNAQGFSGT